MCGIAGLHGAPGGEAAIGAMIGRIRHRGPDAEGFWRPPQEGPVEAWLGHRRLTIIDLSDAANQPYVQDGLALVFNGEIYNYRVLREALAAEGVRFRTSSDTEVIIEAWRAWGPACLRRFRGMFSFALHDVRTGRMVLARDPFGIKPLFYARHGKGWAFASELKALRAVLPAEALEIDHAAFAASLLYSWIPEGHCIHRGIERLPPGHWARIDPDESLVVEPYYDARTELVERETAPIDAAELGEIVRDSVRAHMVADVPVAAFLSGGLDSSLISALAIEHAGSLDAYTIAFREEDQRLEAMPDDLSYARKVADRHGIRLHTIEVAPDVVDMLPRMVEILDEPIGDAAAINAYLICEAARERGVKVLLSGMGADELFAGYRKHLACRLAALYRRLPRAFRKGLVEPVTNALPVTSRRRGYRTIRWAKRFLSFANLDEAAAFQRSYTHHDPSDVCAMLDPAFAPVVAGLVEEHADLYWDGPAGDPINRMCYTDTRHFLPGLNLAYTDRASMAASTEVRVPFVDREVVEAAFRVPGGLKIRGLHGKAILKKAAEPILARDVVYRPKGLFSAPLRAWIRRDLREMVNDLLLDGTLVSSGVLNRARVREVVEQDRAMMEDNSKQVWHLMTMELWYRCHREALAEAARRAAGSSVEVGS